MQFPDMNVNGITVSQEAQVAALRLFLQNDSRRALNLECFLEDVGVPSWRGLDETGKPVFVSYRAADRLLQRARKTNIIQFKKGRWIDSENTAAFLEGTTT